MPCHPVLALHAHGVVLRDASEAVRQHGGKAALAALLDDDGLGLRQVAHDLVVGPDHFARRSVERSGAPVQMGGLAMIHRGGMPVFYYLNDEEIAAAYVYLATYPPQATP